MIRRAVIFLILLMCSRGAFSADVEVHNVRIWHEQDVTRVVLDLNQKAEFHTFFLQNPPRLVVDLPPGRYRGPQISSQHTGQFIDGMRVGTGPSGNLMRLVFDLPEEINFTASGLKPGDGRGHRILMTFEPFGANRSSTIAKSTPAPIPAPSKAIAVTPSVAPARPASDPPQSAPAPARQPVAESAPAAPAMVRGDAVIVVDPGHGGKHPGAVSKRNRTLEKDVTLKLGLELKKQIDAMPGMRAVLTRNKDVYVSLKQRQAIAERHQALAFISIHADAHKSARPRGVSVYALSTKGATSEEARRLADKENASLIFGGDFSHIAPEAQQFVIEAMMDITREWGAELGRKVIKELGKVATVKFPNVEKANFQVLRVPQVAAILVEAGYISNPKDEKALRSAAYRKKISKAIVAALAPFVAKNAGL